MTAVEPIVDPATVCNVCGTCAPAALAQPTAVRCNVRCFRHQTFHVWRCPQCASIHAVEDVDLDVYYASYPKFPVDTERVRHGAFKGMLRRLVSAGLEPHHRILDYGCAAGALVRYFGDRGFSHVSGYDPYTPGLDDPSVLARRYDCVVSQDVIEHVAAPLELLERFDALTEPGGLIAIGTPDAAAIDLRSPEAYVHPLHVPYHRHILSAAALREAGKRRGWSLERYYPTMYGNTLVPMENTRFGLHYMESHDNCLDLLTEPVKMNSWRLWSPVGWFFAAFGYFFDRQTDVQFMFRKRGAPAS